MDPYILFLKTTDTLYALVRFYYDILHHNTLSKLTAHCQANSYEYTAHFSAVGLCKSRFSCLQEHMGVLLLALAPLSLILIGPRASDISSTSTRRPLLSLLLAMSAPSPYIDQIFEPQITLDTWRASRGGDEGNTKIGARRNRLIAALQYVVLLGSIGNILTCSVQLGIFTMMTWNCRFTYLPFIWTGSPLPVWLIGCWCRESINSCIRRPHFLSINSICILYAQALHWLPSLLALSSSAFATILLSSLLHVS
ncbi:hypothetical protein BT63DRAFT_313322 [Microthyrium microscopicum]|uniref:Uncharacterized protein n=1 Tax=Microthyrium microscopicum TaxID=703497 RepID=A0A6A6U4R3_9PEZI|nr:hypothetical protein BT63DRAFT_313322 [Microthyrium microscopicum]